MTDKYKEVDNSEEDTAANTYNISENIDDITTSWGEMRSNGIELQEASSSTFPINDRYIWIKNGTVLNRDEVDSLVTHKPPLYEFDVQPGDTVIVRGKDRNAYIPGFDSTAGIASDFTDNGPDGQYTPDGIEIATGYAILRDGSEEGFPLIFKPNDVEHTIYKEGTKEQSRSLADGDWDFDPFNSEKFQYDITKFSVKRQEFDLYGAGDCTQFFKIRDTNGDSYYVETSTIGLQNSPVIRKYNLPVSLRIDADASRSQAFTAKVGPLQFYNRAQMDIPSRTKETEIRNQTVSNDLGAVDHTVIGVYRLKDGYEEVATDITSLSVKSDSNDVRVEAREMLPQFLSGLPADSEWAAPGDQNPTETSIEAVEAGDSSNTGEFTVGNISHDTFTTDEGKAIPRGRQLVVANARGGQGNSRGERDIETLKQSVSEYKYIVLLAQIDGGSGTFHSVEANFEQRW